MKLIILGDERLKEVSTPVTEFDETLAKTIAEMFKVMKNANGVGLAAPQVGINKRFFIANIDDGVDRVFINPEIIQTSNETVVKEEGCLSVPKFYADVSRASEVTLQFFDLTGKVHTIKAEGLLARVIQHETDHLNGVLFIDRIPLEKKSKPNKSLKGKKLRLLQSSKKKVNTKHEHSFRRLSRFCISSFTAFGKRAQPFSYYHQCKSKSRSW